MIDEDISRIDTKLKKKKESTRNTSARDRREKYSRNSEMDPISCTDWGYNPLSEFGNIKPTEKKSASLVPPNDNKDKSDTQEEADDAHITPVDNKNSKNLIKNNYEKPFLRSSTSQHVT